jgi:hydroxyacylglutathione hydrolase
VNASYTSLPAYERDRIPGGKTLLVHCASGARSAAAAAYLARRGYDVRYVSDSFDRYRKAGTVEAGEAVPA